MAKQMMRAPRWCLHQANNLDENPKLPIRGAASKLASHLHTLTKEFLYYARLQPIRMHCGSDHPGH
jgi:hypothetical protein